MDFLKRVCKRYFIDAMSAMAKGLFASLIIGTIIGQLAKIDILSFMSPLAEALSASSPVIGAAIGVAVAHGLGCKPLVVFSAAATGAIGYIYGAPVGAYLAAVVGCELSSLVVSKTKLDIIVTPFVSIFTGGLLGVYVGPYISSFMQALGGFINEATAYAPIPMGIVVSVIVGMVLTAPISSAALCIMIGIDGIAAGAAAVGCSCQMIGFAVACYRDNDFGGSLSVGVGTSMLQFHNILRHPQIWLAPTLASAILGPISSALLGMTNTSTGAGMGTSGLVGQFGAYEAMAPQIGGVLTVIEIAAMHFILPAVLTLMFDYAFRRWGWIKPGYMKLKTDD